MKRFVLALLVILSVSPSFEMPTLAQVHLEDKSPTFDAMGRLFFLSNRGGDNEDFDLWQADSTRQNASFLLDLPGSIEDMVALDDTADHKMLIVCEEAECNLNALSPFGDIDRSVLSDDYEVILGSVFNSQGDTLITAAEKNGENIIISVRYNEDEEGWEVEEIDNGGFRVDFALNGMFYIDEIPVVIQNYNWVFFDTYKVVINADDVAFEQGAYYVPTMCNESYEFVFCIEDAQDATEIDFSLNAFYGMDLAFIKDGQIHARIDDEVVALDHWGVD